MTITPIILTSQEVVALIKHQIGFLDPNPVRLMALAQELAAAQLREKL